MQHKFSGEFKVYHIPPMILFNFIPFHYLTLASTTLNDLQIREYVTL